MSLTEVYGFDDLWNRLMEVHPEFRLNVSRKDNRAYASAQSSGLVAVTVAEAGESVGPTVRDCLVALHTKLVVRDSEAVAAISAPSVADIIEAKNARIDEIESDRENLSLSVSALSRDLGGCDDEKSFTEAVDQMREKRVSLRELEDEASRLTSEVNDLRAGLDDCDNDDYELDY